MARNFIFPPSTRYTCLQCGRCCANWAVKVEDGVAQKLLDYDWGESYPDLKGRKIFIRRKTDLTENKAYFIRMKKNGKCPFLEKNNFCRIHTDLGYDAKPGECKLFPLSMGEGPKGVHVRTSYYCPAVAANEGKALTAQTRWISQSYRRSGAQSLDETIYLTEGLRIKWSDLLLLESSLLEILKIRSFSLEERLSMGGALIDVLISGAGEGGKSRIGNALRQLGKVGYETLMEGLSASPPSPLRGRLALGLFLVQDTRPTTLDRVLRIPGIALFLMKTGSLKSRLLSAKAGLGKVRKVEFYVSEDAQELLERFFEQKILGKRYIEGGLAVDGGWALMCAAYKLIKLLAKLNAAAEKRAQTAPEDIVKAAGATDLLVIEHTVFFQMNATRGMVNAVLSQPDMYKNVLGAV